MGLGEGVRRAVFDVKTRLMMPSSRRALVEMRANERLSPLELATLVDERSAAIAAHAFATVPFYRAHWSAAGFTAADVAHAGNFTSLPPLTKDHIRDAGDGLLSDAIPHTRALMSKTGGSTGAPLLARNDAGAPTAAMWWRMYEWWGVGASADTAFVYRTLRTGRSALTYAAQWWPTRHIYIDARAMTDASIDAFLDRWDRVHPPLLVGYGQGVHAVAERLEATGRSVHPATAVSVTASMLQAGQRDFIMRAFGCGVYDTYRSAEVPWIASECSAHDGLHVPADQRRVDVVDDAGAIAAPGETGRLLITDFTNRVFPYVRYEIGDRSHTIDGLCACGRTLPRIAPVQGRIADVLRTPSGRRISGGLSGLLLDHGSVVRQLQIVQRGDWSVELRYVPQGDHSAARTAADAAATRLADMLGGEVPVVARAVDAVESVAGKARLVLSELGETASSDQPGGDVQAPPGPAE